MKFATCLNCIDGRVQIPVIDWITKNYDVNYVDMITEPGMDNIISDKNQDISEIYRKMSVTIAKHNSEIIFIVGHYDCAANPVSEKTHKKQISRSVKIINDYQLFKQVIGIWVTGEFSIEKVCEGIKESSEILK
jgi:carbonic anhydrase